MKNFTAAQTARGIPYHPAFRSIAGSVSATILFQQLEFYFAKYPDGFYKFLEPCPGHKNYKEGDSWTEEIGFSKDEFRSAFDNLAIRYRSKKEYENYQESPFFDCNDKEYLYCSYHDKIKGLTFYFRNHIYVDRLLTEVGKANLRKSAKPISVSRQSQLTEVGKANPEYKEHEKTTEKTGNGVSPKGSRQTNPFYHYFVCAYEAQYDSPYRRGRGDNAQFAALRESLNGDLTPGNWKRACKNYFLTPQGSHTLADLCTRFATFRLYPLDRFNKPIQDISSSSSVHCRPEIVV